MDFSKAFDKVPHERLTRTLHAREVNDRMPEFIKKWLNKES